MRFTYSRLLSFAARQARVASLPFSKGTPSPKHFMVAIALSAGMTTPSAFADDWGYEGAAPLPATRPAAKPTIIPPIIEEQVEESAASLAKSMIKPPAKPPGSSVKSNSPFARTPNAVPAKPGSPGSKPAVPGKVPPGGSAASSSPAASKSGSTPANRPLFNTSPVGVDAAVDKNVQAARCWLQLYQACNKQAMDYTQQKRVEAFILGKARLGGKHSEEVLCILKFWPKMMSELRNKPEMEMHYADLFRALLRLYEKTGSEKIEIEGSPYTSDTDLITELLGLERMAVSGNPSFSEDAVNAYADMAIFIYEQTHAGRTIDGPDNRTVFAKVVVQKFNDAPTDADRRAMASFDLAWAKFKIIWFDADEATRKVLLNKLVQKGAASSLTVTKNPLLDTVLGNWPWKTMP